MEQSTAQKTIEESFGAQDMDEKYLYVYGIIDSKEVVMGTQGLNEKPIKKFYFKDIAALTTPYPALNPLLKEEEAMRHAEILKAIAEGLTVIPVAFGTVFKDERILEGVLSKSYLQIKIALASMKGKIEMGVKVVKRENEDAMNEIAQDILKHLQNLCVKSVKGEMFSERLLLNYSFLVEKENFEKFSEEIAELETKHSGLRFIYTGPWPPYSFVNIRIRGGS